MVNFGGSQSDCIYLGGSRDFNLDGTFLLSWNPTFDGRSLVYLYSGGQAIERITFTNIRTEPANASGFGNKYAFYSSGGGNIGYISITNNMFGAKDNYFLSEGAPVYFLTWADNQGLSTTASINLKDIIDCKLDLTNERFTQIAGGTVQRSNLRYYDGKATFVAVDADTETFVKDTGILSIGLLRVYQVTGTPAAGNSIKWNAGGYAYWN